MRKPDHTFDDIGAEALPGGLRDINEISRPGFTEQAPSPKPPPRAPLVGLVDLVSSWLRRPGNGR